MGKATVLIDGKKRYAACIGGVLSMMDGKATLVATTFEWADSIDLKRVNRSEEQARAVLADPKSTDTELRLAQARLKRALIRKNVADKK
jgi:F-type H+-transporting ATPase subunit epsilon